MRYPGSVVSVICFALFVRADLGECFFIRFFIILDWNLGSHSTHRVDVPAVASLDTEQRVRPHEMSGHCNQSAIGKNEIWLVPESLDAAEDVVPTPTVQAGGMFS